MKMMNLRVIDQSVVDTHTVVLYGTLEWCPVCKATGLALAGITCESKQALNK